MSDFVYLFIFSGDCVSRSFIILLLHNDIQDKPVNKYEFFGVEVGIRELTAEEVGPRHKTCYLNYILSFMVATACSCRKTIASV